MRTNKSLYIQFATGYAEGCIQFVLSKSSPFIGFVAYFYDFAGRELTGRCGSDWELLK